MPTDKQLNANRANAKHSTGPKSPEGKARVAANRLTHGLASRHVILPGESQQDYDDILAAILADLAPNSPIEDILAHQAAEAHWKLRRIARYEAELLERYPNPFLDDEAARKLAQLSRYEASARRAFHKALEDFRRHRAESRRTLAGTLDTALLAALKNESDNSNPIPPQPQADQQETPPPDAAPPPGPESETEGHRTPGC